MNRTWIIGLVLLITLTSCLKKTEETKPIRKDITETVFASGVLEANGMYQLTAQTDGYLAQVNFKQNDIINAGEVLAVINNPQNILNTQSAETLYDIARRNTQPNAPSLAQARNAAEIARQQMAQDSLQVARYKRLLDANSIARAEYEKVLLQYQTAQTNYANAVENYNIIKQQAEQQLVINEAQKKVNKVLAGYNELRAIVTGKVYHKLKEKGDFVRQGDVIATIGDPNFIYAKVSIDENNIRKVKLGQEAVIQLNIDESKTYNAKVAEILPSFNEANQSFTCKLFFIDSLDFNIINTQLQANIIVGVNKNALLIPRHYLNYGNYVTVKGKEKPIQIKTRFVSSEWVQVDAGIDENTILITDNIKQ
ncbi:MAG: efflux RND transporter periplasmic adaptor subunit [Saprospiraceae bacterium]